MSKFGKSLVVSGIIVLFSLCAKYGECSSLHAVIEENPIKAKEMIQKGADVNQKDEDGSTPLMAAISSGDMEIIRLLLKHGAKIDEKDTEGSTALIVAIDRSEDGDSKILSLLHHNLFISCGDDLIKKEMVSHINPTFIVMYIKNRQSDPVYQNWRKSENETKVDESLLINYFTSLVEGILRDPQKEQECVHNKSYIKYEPQQNPIFSVKEDDKKYCIRNKFTDPPLLEALGPVQQ